MASHVATAEWIGDFKSGRGTMKPGSDAFVADFCIDSVLGNGPGSNPTEVLAAGLAGCFCSTLAAMLAASGHSPKKVAAQAHAHLEKVSGSYCVTFIDLEAVADVSGLDETALQELASRAVKICPIGKALSAVEICLKVKLA